MAETTKISWANHTANVWQGCTKVSVEASGGGACDHCYAEARDKRFHAGAHWGQGAPRLPRLEAFARDMRGWNRKAREAGVRRSVFVNSLSDFFDSEVPQEWRDFAYHVFADCAWLDIDLLTKRPGLVMKMLPPTWQMGFPGNVRLGISVCNQAEYDRDVDKLLAIPARVRYLSLEPLLGPIRLGFSRAPALNTITHASEFDEREPTERSWKIHWVIAGGESGRNARPAHPQWFRDIRDQCAAVRVPFHFKQWGEFSPIEITSTEYLNPTDRHLGERVAGANGELTALPAADKVTVMRRVGTKASGHLIDGVEHLAFPRSDTEGLAAR